MGIRKEDADRESVGEALMLCHLFAPIIRQRFPQWGRDLPELLGKSLVRTPGIRAGHAGQEDEPGRPLDQCADSRAIARPLEEVAFLVARHRAGGHLSGTLGDGRHVGNVAAAVCASCPRSTGLASLTQRRLQLASQGASRQHIQTSIDGFCREVFPHIVRIRALEATSNLFGQAAHRQLCLNMLPQPRVKEFTWPPWMMSSGDGVALRRTGSV